MMKDFFISYNQADLNWAKWIDFQLRAANYTTVVQAYDFRPGSNFVLEMQKASITSKCTIALLSEDYLKAQFTQPEWTAAFAQDPTSETSKLLPIKVQECTPPGMLRPIVYIDLVGRDVEEAKEELKNQIDKVFQNKSARPDVSPTFPGSTPNPQTKSPIYPANLPWNVPVKRNPFFTGREEVLEELEKHLHAGSSVALSGLGGVGKTQTAAEYAYRHRGDYQAILWAGAASQEILISSFVALAGLLNLPEKDAQDQELIVATVQRWLRTNKD